MPGPLNTVFGLALAAAPFITLLLAAGVVGRFAERVAPFARLPREAIADLTMPVFIAGLAAARVVQILPAWKSVAANPLDLLRFTGAGQLSPLGGILGASLAFLVFARRYSLPLVRTADLYGLVLPLGFAVYDGGCVIRGDCYGRVAPAPFGIMFPGFEFPHYPVGLYAAALALILYAGLIVLAQRHPTPGFVAVAAVIGLAGSSVLLSPLNLEGSPTLLDGQQVMIVALTLAVLLVTQVAWLWKTLRAVQPTRSGDGDSH